MYSTATAASAPSTTTAMRRASKRCSGLPSKTIVVEICRKFPLTMAYKYTRPVADNISAFTRYVLNNNPAGAANENTSKCGSAFVRECN